MERGVEFSLIVGLLLVVLIGWLPIVGPLVVGYISGLHAASRREGAIMGFSVGAIGSLVLVWLVYIALSEVFIVTEGVLSNWIGGALTFFFSLGPLPMIAHVVLLSTLGGALGARVRNQS